jgi:hypothetical protein
VFETTQAISRELCSDHAARAGKRPLQKIREDRVNRNGEGTLDERKCRRVRIAATTGPGPTLQIFIVVIAMGSECSSQQ